MPRTAEPEDLEQVFPWGDWAEQLEKAPTKALFFGPDDFGAISPYVFQRKARKEFASLNVSVRVRGKEVLVSLA